MTSLLPPASPRPETTVLTVPADATLFHITHWKAGSQWIRALMDAAFGPAVVPAEYFEAQALQRPILSGKAYSCVYLSRLEFQTISLPADVRRFVLIRDLRDSLVSLYFSIRNSHSMDNGYMQRWRQVLRSVNEEDGFLYLMEGGFNQYAYIQRTWLEAGEHCFRLEDMMTDPAGTLDKVFRERWRIEVDRPYLDNLVSRCSFEKLSGGRKPGEEDSNSHYRKGVAGDWRLHFTPKVTQRFKYLYSDLLVMAGYEKDGQW